MMRKLRKSLSEASTARRHRRNLLNIQITSFAWLVEFVAFLFLFISKLILRNESNISEFVLVQLGISIYVIILPSIYLINDDNVKGSILESDWYETVLRVFGLQYNPSVRNAPADEDDITSNNDNDQE